METTPSSASTRRITRSQIYAAANNSDHISTLQKMEEPSSGSAKSKQRSVVKQQDRSALIDITNDSPIVGLAMGKFGTPSSLKSRKSFIRDNTPGSGEEILRGQVKTLLQKVEEEAEFSKVSSFPKRRPPLNLQDHYFTTNSSPMGLILVAPTPANTPQILSNPSAVISSNSIAMPSILESNSPQGEEELGLTVSRSLMLDFSDKSEGSSNSSKCSSVMTCQEGGGSSNKATTEDDDPSIWSIQVNASSNNDQETDEEDIEEEVINKNNDYYFKETDEENDAGMVDELCEAISKISVNGNGQAKFRGKRTKFVYNSDDELEGEEVVVVSGENDDESAKSVGVLKLQGWPSPKGKHVRFPEAV